MSNYIFSRTDPRALVSWNDFEGAKQCLGLVGIGSKEVRDMDA
jgi:hypothetical protein